MAHPTEHAKSSARKWGRDYTEYTHIHDWFDATKAWVGHSDHRMFRHHSEGIFEAEKIFGVSFVNTAGRTVYTRYVGEQHVKEDCYNYIPSAREWVQALESKEKPMWMVRTLEIKIED